MKTKLSHSAVSKYQDCPTAYRYHYIEGYRSKTKSGALFFGTAIDKAMEELLITGQGGVETFEANWLEQEHNGRKLYLPLSTEIVYAESDYDEDLMLPEDWQSISNMLDLPEGFDIKEKLASIYKQKKAIGFDLLSKDNKTLLNLANWKCLRRKGLVMIEALKQEVLPNIEQVLGTQEKVELVNELGDSVVGYVDIVAKLKGHDEPVILDLKTSTRMYEEDSVLTSPQLSLYVWGLHDKYKTSKAGYVVLLKSISKNKLKLCKSCGNDGSSGSHKTCNATGPDGKRCHGEFNITINPKASVQIIIDSIPERVQNMVVENFNEVNHAIKSGTFTKNLQSCIKPYGKCAFYNICWKGTEEGLVKSETSR